jgi:hypothetical protein
MTIVPKHQGLASRTVIWFPVYFEVHLEPTGGGQGMVDSVISQEFYFKFTDSSGLSFFPSDYVHPWHICFVT